MANLGARLRVTLARIGATCRVLLPTARAAVARSGHAAKRKISAPAPSNRDAAQAVFEDVADAMGEGRIEALKDIAAKGIDLFGGTEPESGQPWFHVAVELGDIAVIRWMLENGSDPNSTDAVGDCAGTALLNRDSPDMIDVFELLHAHGLPVNKVNAQGMTPLHYASAAGILPFVQRLLELGADPTIRTDDQNAVTPEEIARTAGHGEVAEFIENWRQD